MSENTGLPIVISDAQRNLVMMSTPPHEIFQRKGRGGQAFDYVKVGYVIEQLNLCFGFNWDFDILKHEFNSTSDEVVVLARLTVRAGGETITKTQFGGTAVKRAKKTNAIISLADDHKAAAADALKKCASLLGIAHDVYRGQANSKPIEKTKHWIDAPNVRRRFWSFSKGVLGLSEDQAREAMGVEHIHDFTGTMKDAKQLLEDYAVGQDQA